MTVQELNTKDIQKVGFILVSKDFHKKVKESFV